MSKAVCFWENSKRPYTVSFHLHEILKQAKLMNDGKKIRDGCLWSSRVGLTGK
jgi:hypothetical protein